MKRTYLGDGCYASDDGFQFWLFAERDGIEHAIALDGGTMQAFLVYVEKQRSVKIKVERNDDEHCS